MNIKPITLTGQYVRLVPMETNHIAPLFEAARHPEIWIYTQVNIKTMLDMENYVRKALGGENTLPFVITDKATGTVLGSTRYYEISKANRSLEIGHTWLTPHVWRTAVNTECKYLLLNHCFESLGMLRVQFKADARNVRSQQALSRIGAFKEGVFRNHIILNSGYVRDSVFYSVIDSEWPETKSRLEVMMR